MNRPRLALVLTLGLAMPGAAFGQDKAPPPSTAPSPAEKNPLSTTTSPDPKPGGGTAMPAPEKSLAPPSPPGAAPARAPTPPMLQTLVPNGADTGDVDEVTLPAKPAAILTGKAKKADTVTELKASFQTIADALAKAGIKPVGRPLAVFTNAEDDVLQYDAMIPIEAAPAQPPVGVEGLRFATTPSGKGFRFRHSGAYDEIDGTYEVFSAYLDVKGATVRDEFIEEYVTDLKDGADDKLDVNIYALRK